MPDKQPPDPVAKAADKTAVAAQATVAEIAKAAPVPEVKAPDDGGMWKTVKNTAVSFAVVTLGGYFIWLGVTVAKVNNTLDMVADQVKSLLLTRETQATEQSDRNTRRVEELERDARNEGD